MQFPLSLLSNGCRFEVFGVDPSESRSQCEEVVSVTVGDYRGRYLDFKLPAAFLLQVADMIYRLTGRAPHAQQVRVEVVAPTLSIGMTAAAGASEAPPRPRLQLVDPDNPPGDQVETIRARMLSGK